MSIRLPMVINSVPDSVQSQLSHDSEKINKYKWRFRSKDDKGIDLVIKPFNDSDTIKWCIEIYNVEWTGNDYSIKSTPFYTHDEEKFNTAISYANEKVTELFNNEYNHIN